MVTIQILLLVSQGNDFRLMAMVLGVSKPRYNAHYMLHHAVPGRSKADMAEDISHGCSSDPRKKSIHHLPRLPQEDTPRVMIVRY